MTSVEFGIIPVKILFEQLDSCKNNNYNKKIKDLKDLYRKKCDELIDRINNGKKERILKKENFEIKGCYKGKVEIYIDNELYDELYDHSKEITDFYYNIRLNMFSTISKDGFLCLYMIPNKLVTTIKNKYGNYFNKVFLSSNPFPTIIVYDEKRNELISYSINGFFISSKKFEINEKIWIFDWFDENGGTYKDRLIIIKKEKEKTFICQTLTVPFFEEEEESSYVKSDKSYFCFIPKWN